MTQKWKSGAKEYKRIFLHNRRKAYYSSPLKKFRKFLRKSLNQFDIVLSILYHINDRKNVRVVKFLSDMQISKKTKAEQKALIKAMYSA